MVKAIINPQAVLDNIMDEEFYLEASSMESIYAMRKLNAAVNAAHIDQIITLGEAHDHGQKYSEQYQIWFNEEEFMVIKNAGALIE